MQYSFVIFRSSAEQIRGVKMAQFHVAMMTVFCYLTTTTYANIYTINDLFFTSRRLKDCPYRKLGNGKSIPRQISYESDSVVTYLCDNDYTLRGSQTATCDNGQWSTKIPLCRKNAKPKYCNFRNLKHGFSRPRKTKYADRDVVNFKCDDGYILKGNKADACSKGQWTLELPKCEAKPKRCPYRKLMHGTVTPKKAFYKFEAVAYDCDTGYDLEGVARAACFDGKWSAELPQCTASRRFSGVEVYCRAPKFPRGTFAPRPSSNQKYATGSYVTFRCKGAYHMKGPRSATCMENGEWDEIPVCQAVCRQPIVTNGFYNTESQISGGYLFPGSKLKFGCSSTYKLLGKSTVTCLENGKWSTKLPVCEKWIISVTEDGCPPPEFHNGLYAPVLTGGKTVYYVGEKVVFVCHDDRLNQGENYGTCLANGEWDNIPTCSDECAPPTISHGSISPPDGIFKKDSVIILNCFAGYLPIGPSRATCLPGGIWSAQLRCSDGCYAPSIAHMNILPVPAAGGNVYNFGHRIQFKCDAGFSSSVRDAECRGGNKWDKALPKCNVLSAATGCPMPVLSEGLLLKNQRQPVYEYKTQLEFNCDAGFSMVGSAVSICRKHLRALAGAWDPSPPVCNRAKCGAPGQPQNGRFRDGQKDAYYFGDTVYFECNDKHIMSGNDHVTCQADGQFSGIPPKCRPPSCRIQCKYVDGRECQCDATCRMRKDCCHDFEQHCRKLFY